MEPKANNLPEGSGVETIDLNGDYPLEVLSYYIWGQKERPKGDEIVNEYYANRKYGGKTINLNFSKQQYLEKFFGIKNTDDLKALSKRFGLFNTFFNSNGKTKSGANLDFSEYEDRISNGEMVLSHDKFVEIFYRKSSNKVIKDASRVELPISFYKKKYKYGGRVCKGRFYIWIN